MLTVLDEYSRECLAIVVTRRLQADDVLQTLSELFAEHGPPANLRSDNGPEFTARVVRQWLGELGVKTLFIEPGSPWENGYNESFNGTLRNELLKREIFHSLEEAKVLIEQWRREYNTHRPHSSLGYRPPAPEAIRPDPKLLNPTSASWTTPQPKGGAWTNTLGGTAFGGRSMPVSGFPCTLGNTSGLSSPATRASSRISRARRHSGTQCSRFAFVRRAGIPYNRSSRPWA